MTTPKHIWSGSWLSESEDAEAARRRDGLAAPAATPAVEEPAPAPIAAAEPPVEPLAANPGPEPVPEPATIAPPPRRRGRGLLATLLVALVAGAAGAGGMALLLDNNDNNGSQTTAGASTQGLPASSANAARPTGGETVATAVFNEASPAVVSIRTTIGSGTGFLIDDKGTLVTNDHVVEGNTARTVHVRFGTDGKILSGTVLATDPSTDLAAVRINPSEIPAGVKPLHFADSDRLVVGATVLAIGNPFNLDRTLTTGVVSSLGRTIQAPNHFPIDNAIQTDAAINPGNSGGPLLNDQGNVVGVNSQIATASAISQGNVGIGFAVPSNTVRRVLPTLIGGKTFEHAWLGVTSGLPTRSTVAGAQIEALNPNGPAKAAGLRAGDVITAIDGRKLADPSLLSEIIDAKRPGQSAAITVDRAGTTKTIDVTLGTRPNKVPQPSQQLTVP